MGEGLVQHTVPLAGCGGGAGPTHCTLGWLWGRGWSYTLYLWLVVVMRLVLHTVPLAGCGGVAGPDLLRRKGRGWSEISENQPYSIIPELGTNTPSVR